MVLIMVIKQNVYSQKLWDILCKPIKFQKKCYCLCLLVRHDKFICWLDMINSHGFYAWNNVKVVKDDKIRNLFLDTYTI